MAPVRPHLFPHLFPLLALTTLALAACGGPAPSPTPTPPPGPQPYTRTITVQNWIGAAVRGTSPQSAGQDASVTLDLAENGTGTITFGVPSPVPAKAQALSQRLLGALGCPTATGLTLTNDPTAYAEIGSLFVRNAAGANNVVALVNDKVRLVGENTFSYDEGGKSADFFFVAAAATIQGTVTCGTAPQSFPVVFDLSLRPGWNIVTRAFSGGRFTLRTESEAGLNWRVLPPSSAQSVPAGPRVRVTGVDVPAR